jgi:hypothetical protein
MSILASNSLTVKTPKSTALNEESVPRNFPIGVRATPQITAFGWDMTNASMMDAFKVTVGKNGT